MKVVDFKRTYTATARSDFEGILSERYGTGVNAFWLSDDAREYPTLSILVKGDLAVLHYIPVENEAGFRSVGEIAGLDETGTTTFSISENAADDVIEPNAAVVPFSVALSVANEFFTSSRLPMALKWEEL